MARIILATLRANTLAERPIAAHRKRGISY